MPFLLIFGGIAVISLICEASAEKTRNKAIDNGYEYSRTTEVTKTGYKITESYKPTQCTQQIIQNNNIDQIRLAWFNMMIANHQLPTEEKFQHFLQTMQTYNTMIQ